MAEGDFTAGNQIAAGEIGNGVVVKTTTNSKLPGRDNELADIIVPALITTHDTDDDDSHGGKVAFSVHKNGTSQTGIAGVTDIIWGAEVFDKPAADDYFDLPNDLHQPLKTGDYLYIGSVTCIESGGNPMQVAIQIMKISTIITQYFVNLVANGKHTLTISKVINMDGVSDTVRLRALRVSGSGTFDISGAIIDTYFEGFKTLGGS